MNGDTHEEAQPSLRPGPEEVRYQTEHEWRIAVLGELRQIRLLLAHWCVLAEHPLRVVERPEPPVEKEAAAVEGESAENAEPLGTWILTDARVQAIEEAIVQEQRVRGQAFDMLRP